MNPERSQTVGYSDAFQALMLMDALDELATWPRALARPDVDMRCDPGDSWAELQQIAGILRLSLGQAAWMRVAQWNDVQSDDELPPNTAKTGRRPT